jgi:serine/threonine protein kinase
MSERIVVKGYQVGKKLEQSGFRTLYSGRKLRTGEPVVITVISVRKGPSLNALQRRAGQSKKLMMPGVVKAIDYGTIGDGEFYFTSAATDARSILEVLDRIPKDRDRMYAAVRFFMKLLPLVGYLHDAGTSHRDLNSSVVKVDSRGDVFLDGFINARPKVEARNIIHIVHLPYLAPEQLQGAPADRRTDIYSLGVMLFEWVIGQLPYASNYAKVEDFRQGAVVSPSDHKMDLPEGLEAALVKAMASRADRYGYVGTLLVDLERFYANRPIGHKLRDLAAMLRGLLPTRSQRKA